MVPSSAQILNINMIGARQLGQVLAASSVDQPIFVKSPCAMTQILTALAERTFLCSGNIPHPTEFHSVAGQPDKVTAKEGLEHKT